MLLEHSYGFVLLTCPRTGRKSDVGGFRTAYLKPRGSFVRGDGGVVSVASANTWIGENRDVATDIEIAAADSSAINAGRETMRSPEDDNIILATDSRTKSRALLIF